MSVQQNPVDYAEAIQAQLTTTVAPVPVYAVFNRNFATQPKFLTWQLRNVHQPVYTGQIQSNKGIDRPVFRYLSLLKVCRMLSLSRTLYYNHSMDIQDSLGECQGLWYRK
jgi:hypothetical protein